LQYKSDNLLRYAYTHRNTMQKSPASHEQPGSKIRSSELGMDEQLHAKTHINGPGVLKHHFSTLLFDDL